MSGQKKHILNFMWLLSPLVFVMAAMCVGRYSLSLHAVLSALLEGPSATAKDTASLIVYNVRLPRTILAFTVGAGLSVAGSCFQSIFSNPLASPDTLGVSSGAAFGAALGILMSFNILGVQLCALCFGVLAIAMTFFLSSSPNPLAISVSSPIFNRPSASKVPTLSLIQSALTSYPASPHVERNFATAGLMNPTTL